MAVVPSPPLPLVPKSPSSATLVFGLRGKVPVNVRKLGSGAVMYLNVWVSLLLGVELVRMGRETSEGGEGSW